MNQFSYQNVEALSAAMRDGFSPKWLFFWGHTPAKDGSVSKSCFSQWWDGHPFPIGDDLYRTAEHYMMAEKARLFRDDAILKKILDARTPAEAKKLGRKVQGFNEAQWLERRWDIVVRGNLAKFGAHVELREFLINTGSRVLVEASPYDQIWGIGMVATDDRAENPERWKGLHLLGFALMEVRAILLNNRLA